MLEERNESQADSVSQRSFFRYFPYKELTLFSDDHTQVLADLVMSAPAELDPISTLDWAASKLFEVPTTDLDRRRQAIRNQLGDDIRIQRHVARLHESLSARLREAFITRLGIEPHDTADLRPQILVGLYLSLAAEASRQTRALNDTRRLWMTSLRRLL